MSWQKPLLTLSLLTPKRSSSCTIWFQVRHSVCISKQCRLVLLWAATLAGSSSTPSKALCYTHDVFETWSAHALPDMTCCHVTQPSGACPVQGSACHLAAQVCVSMSTLSADVCGSLRAWNICWMSACCCMGCLPYFGEVCDGSADLSCLFGKHVCLRSACLHTSSSYVQLSHRAAHDDT